MNSTQVGERVLAPAMDAIALGEERARLIHSPETPEPDSLVELLNAQVAIVLRLAKANGLGLQADRAIAGWADELATTLRRSELDSEQPSTSGRALAATLRPLLDALADPSEPHKFALARRALHRTFADEQPSVLLSKTVLHHLRPVRARALEAAYAAWENQRAAREQRMVGHRESRA